MPNRPIDFKDNLPRGYDGFDWAQKINLLWKLNLESDIHKMYDPSPGDESSIFGDPNSLPNAKKVLPFVRDSLDFRDRSLDSIAELTVFSRLRDVYPVETRLFGVIKVKHKRLTHPTGSLAWVRFEPAQDTPYTGMFKQGAHGLLRASSATNPYITDVLNRAAAIKFPVSGSYSRSLFAMNRIVAQKLGPDHGIAIKGDPSKRELIDYRYFKAGKNLTNILPPPQGVFESKLVEKFSDVVKYILTATGKMRLGEENRYNLSDLASRLSVDNMSWHYQNGEEVEGEARAPFRVTLVPNPELYKGGPISRKMDFRDTLTDIKPDTVLWTVYGMDKPADPEKVNPFRSIDEPINLDPSTYPSRFGRVIGTIVLKKPFRASVFANEQIMFKHFVADLQSKEDLDTAFLTVGEDKLEPETNNDFDKAPDNFMVQAPTSAINCDGRVKTNFADNPRKQAVFQKYLQHFDFMTSDVAPFCMARKNLAPGFPPELQGVWWMNGNPVAETLVAFGNAEWDNDEKTLKLDPHWPYSWAWYASRATRDGGSIVGGQTTDELAGMKQFRGVTNQYVKFRYTAEEFQREGEVKINAFAFSGLLHVPRAIFDMRFLDLPANYMETNPEVVKLGVKTFEDPDVQGPDAMVRRTRILSGLIQGDYRFTRIVDGEGKPLKENYQAYLDEMRKFNLVYTGIKNNVPLKKPSK